MVRDHDCKKIECWEKNWAMPPRILLIDNSKPECAIFTPKLLTLLQNYGVVTACNTRTETIAALATPHYDAIVFSGSSLNMSESLVTAAISKDLMMLLRHPDVPCLGVCFGMQLIAVAYGGEVERLQAPRVGELATTYTAFGEGASRDDLAYFSHQDVVVAVPPDFAIDGTSDGYVSVMHSDKFKRFGVQFHPECSQGAIASIVPEFLRRAMQASVSISPTLRISPALFREVGFWIGLKRAQKGASEYAIERDDVEEIWRRFRNMFRIPAILL
jgi:GMP synthase-like glutamine amidotransferase